MKELWPLHDKLPQQHLYVNVVLLMKLFFYLPCAFVYLAYALIEDRELHFVYGFFAFWGFALMNVLLPLFYTIKRHGCKKDYVLSTPNFSVFSVAEVRHYYEADVANIRRN